MDEVAVKKTYYISKHIKYPSLSLHSLKKNRSGAEFGEIVY